MKDIETRLATANKNTLNYKCTLYYKPIHINMYIILGFFSSFYFLDRSAISGDFASETKYKISLKYLFSWGLVRLSIASCAFPRLKGSFFNSWISLLNCFILLVAWLMQFISRLTWLFSIRRRFSKKLVGKPAK